MKHGPNEPHQPSDKHVRSPQTWLERELAPGTIINAKYRVESLLGRGAQGVVVLCEHLELGQRVALKFLSAMGGAGSDDLAARFRREAQVCVQLKNQHVTRVVDVGVWREDAAFMVMEYLDGTDLRRLLRQMYRLPVDLAVNYVVQLCEGLAEAHARGIVHRDLKPSNVFIAQDVDGSDLVKILDFGISKVTEGPTPDETTERLVLGSPKYMSPEQFFAPSSVGPRSDIWAIGVILYEMLAGRPPLEAGTRERTVAWLSSEQLPASLCAERSDVTPVLESVVFRCLERNAEDRMPDVAELAGELLYAIDAPNADSVFETLESILRTAAAGDAQAAAPSASVLENAELRSTPGRAPSFRKILHARKRRRLVSAVALAGLLAAAAGLWWFVQRANARQVTQAAGAPAEAPSIHVVVRATPPEAMIEIDGHPLGTSPLSFDVAADSGDHTVRISADGYATDTRSVPFARNLLMDVSLEKLTGPPSPSSAPSPRPPKAAAHYVVPPKPAPARSKCSPPYYFSNGIKTYKLECL